MSVFRGREKILLSIHRPVYRLSFFLPVLSGDGDVLKMLNAHCFHGDKKPLRFTSWNYSSWL